jgi:hypothetical protein
MGYRKYLEYEYKKILKARERHSNREDDVEYVLNDKGVSFIERGHKIISLIQLYDGQVYLFDIETVLKAIEKGGIIDYLEKRNR